MQMPQGLGAQHSGDVRGDGNLLRAQTAAAGLAVNAQLRADENRLRHRALDLTADAPTETPPLFKADNATL